MPQFDFSMVSDTVEITIQQAQQLYVLGFPIQICQKGHENVSKNIQFNANHVDECDWNAALYQAGIWDIRKNLYVPTKFSAASESVSSPSIHIVFEDHCPSLDFKGSIEEVYQKVLEFQKQYVLTNTYVRNNTLFVTVSGSK